MANSILNEVWRQKRYTEARFLVLLALADWSDDGGHSWPGIVALADRCNITDRAASRIISQLIGDGVILPTRGGGRGKLSGFQLVLDRLNPASKPSVSPMKTLTGGTVFLQETLTLRSGFSASNPDRNDINPDRGNTVSMVNPDPAVRVFTSENPDRNDINPDRNDINPDFGECAYKEVDPMNPMEPENTVTRKPISRKSKPKNSRQPDQLVEIFRGLINEANGCPAQFTTADFVQLAALRKTCQANSWDLTEERFRQAAENYFRSEIGTHTLRDLCSRFSAFFRSPLDRYGKPISSGNGKAGQGTGTQFTTRNTANNQAAAEEAIRQFEERTKQAAAIPA